MRMKMIAYQATFAWRVWRTQAADRSIEVPFVASPAFTVVTPGASLPLEIRIAVSDTGRPHNFPTARPRLVLWRRRRRLRR